MLAKLWFALLVLAPLAAPAAPQSCLVSWKTLARVPRDLWTVTDTTTFNPESFEHAKKFFENKFSHHEKVTAKDFQYLGASRSSILLAFMEASATRAGTKASGVRYSLASSPEFRKAEEKVLASLDLSKPMAWADFEDFLERLYVAGNHPVERYQSLPTWLATRLPTPPKEILRQRLQEAIWKHDFLGALDDLGITRDPGLRDNVRNWLANHRNIQDAVYTTGLDLFTYKLLGIPVRIADIHLTRAITISPEILERARAEGFDAVYDDLYKLYGNYAKFDLAWQAARTSVNRSAVVLIAVGILAALKDHPYLVNPQYWKFLHKFKYVDDHALEDLQMRVFDAEAVRHEQFLSFKKAYEDGEGPFDEMLPNPWESDYAARAGHFPASYREEADATWRVLKGMTPGQLKATFGSQLH